MVDGIWSLQYMAAGPICGSAGPLSHFRCRAPAGSAGTQPLACQPFTHAVLFRYASAAARERFEAQPRVQLMLGGTGAPAGTGVRRASCCCRPRDRCAAPPGCRCRCCRCCCVCCDQQASVRSPTLAPVSPVLQASPLSTSRGGCPTSWRRSSGAAQNGRLALSWWWRWRSKWVQGLGSGTTAACTAGLCCGRSVQQGRTPGLGPPPAHPCRAAAARQTVTSSSR